jgi:hypothetical protein
VKTPKNPEAPEHRAHMLRATRCLLFDRSYGAGPKPTADLRNEAFVFFRFVQGYTLAKALRATNNMYPPQKDTR